MKTGMYMLPVRCKGCNATFDLWNTLQDQESKGGVYQNEQLQRLSQTFCPRCRLAVLSELGEVEIETSQIDHDDSESESFQEFEMLIDFE